ncbi:MAG: helix-hairpin-helix domain-containing protein, partial [Tannerella sp.]|nr:helix-hairpin-helix domain-containing protein [Tannerella sp.]
MTPVMSLICIINIKPLKMLWRDFFYFSKGERRSLIVLLCLITVAGIILIWNDPPEPGANTGQADTLVDSGKSENVSIATDSRLSSQPSGGESSSSPAKPALSKKNAPSSGSRLSSSSPSSESVPERVKRLTSSSRPTYVRTEKFPKGTVVELNTADTVILKKVPGIGSAFSKRIVNYRNLLGGYYSVTQLSEVYGIDEEKYNALMPWFSADPSLI